jgi:hypothetical protein
MAGAEELLAVTQKDAYGSPHLDYDATYIIAMTKLQFARHFIAAGDLPSARTYLTSLSNEKMAEVVGGLATTEIIMARAQMKSDDSVGARATLSQAANIAANIQQNGSPVKYGVLRDLADAQTLAGDIVGARAALTIAAPLAYIYSDSSQTQLGIVEAQLKIGDVEGAQKTAELMKDTDIKAKAMREIADPPKVVKPDPTAVPFPPLPSQYLALPSNEPALPPVKAEQWIALLELSFDAPFFTAFADDSDVNAMAAEIQKEPVRIALHAGPLDQLQSLTLVTNRMVDAQIEIDRMLKLQFGP